MWTSTSAKISTCDNLMKRWQNCVACVGDVVNLWIICCCIVTKMNYEILLSVFGFHWVMRKTMFELLSGWRNWCSKPSGA